MTGLETTAAGPAAFEFEPANWVPQSVHVYDAEYVALVEFFKKYLKKNARSLSGPLLSVEKKGR